MVTKAEKVAEGTRPMRRDRFVKVTGVSKGVDWDLVERARQLAGLKDYVTNLAGADYSSVLVRAVDEILGTHRAEDGPFAATASTNEVQLLCSATSTALTVYSFVPNPSPIDFLSTSTWISQRMPTPILTAVRAASNTRAAASACSVRRRSTKFCQPCTGLAENPSQGGTDDRKQTGRNDVTHELTV